MVLEEEPDKEKINISYNQIGWSYIFIGLAYVILIAISYFIAQAENIDSSAKIWFIFLGSISIPIILSGFMIKLQERYWLIITSICLSGYVVFMFMLIRSLYNEGGLIHNLMFVFFTLIPGILLVINFFILKWLFKTTP